VHQVKDAFANSAASDPELARHGQFVRQQCPAGVRRTTNQIAKQPFDLDVQQHPI
jgi:hypothetical protein